MSEALKILEGAITDVGHWRWWARSDVALQLEFGWVMLLVPSDDPKEPPSNVIALRFNKPRCIVALWPEDSDLPDDWLAKLQEDKLDPLGVDHVDFTLTDRKQLQAIFRSAIRREFILGTEQDLSAIGPNDAFLAFWAGAGMIIIGQSMQILSHKGPIATDNIPAMHAAWWKYWREYWARKDSKNPMPKDNLCEVTIPLKE